MNLLLVIALSWFSFSAQTGVAKTQDVVQVPAQGKMDGEAIKKVFELGADKIDKCYKDHVKNNAEGQLVIDFTVDKKGNVKNISADHAKSTFAENAAFETCIEDRVRTWIFPPAPAGAESAQIAYPLNFSFKKK